MIALAGIGLPLSLSSDAAERAMTAATDKSRYCTMDPITAIITNPLRETMYTYSGRSYCTVVEVERVRDGAGESVGRCVAGAPPGVVEITPLSERSFVLDRFDPVFEAMTPGRYRLRFCYRLGAIEAPEACVQSAEFEVVACYDD